MAISTKVDIYGAYEIGIQLQKIHMSKTSMCVYMCTKTLEQYLRF